ncbi:MAG TPA: hydantoinase/oxoprolinase family protein [Thiolinea sp.]|nr:hydantoinase/oxoprolinase family protein [Thiolinea sp.]
MASYNIGIDTGGTYTDAVIVNPRTHAVLAAAKALTTRGNLALGVTEALEQVLEATAGQLQRDEITLVSLSTTLATNALVEGKGAGIAVVLIGFDDPMLERTELAAALPDARIIRIRGGHRYDGSEQEVLDETALRTALEQPANQAEAYAVAGLYSVRNADHERRAQALIRELRGCPVTASHELSEALNGPRRALTAAFNARIIGLIVSLTAAVRTVLQERSIHAPLMIVKGDGSIASAATVVERPIETILSGPAASVIGAGFLSGLRDFLIADIGGTTTDVAIVKNGWPDLNEKGAMIGTHRTMVRAIDIQTIGLGGDSTVDIDHQGRIRLKPERVVPAAMIGARWPSVQQALQTTMHAGMGLGIGTLFLFRPQGTADRPLPADLTAADRGFLANVGEEPIPWSRIVNSVSARYRVMRLVNRGILQLAGFTPSDAAHVLGHQSQWSRPVALLVCAMIGRSHGRISFDDQKLEAECRLFAQTVFDAMVTQSTQVMLERLAGTRFAVDDPLVSTITQGGNRHNDLLICLRPAIPLVAVGGPAPVFYPEVGRRLGTETVIPPHSAVANAIGAAIGMIRVQAQVEITRAEGDGYHLHGAGAVIFIPEAVTALAQAEALARELARQRTTVMGGEVQEITVVLERLDIPGREDDRGLISATLTADCLSRPVTLTPASAQTNVSG